MVTRVADAASNENIVRILLQTQARLKDRELQVASGKVAQTYTGLAQESERLVNLENQRDILDRFVRNNDTVELRLSLVAESLETIQGVVKDFRTNLSTYRSGVLDDQTAVEIVQKQAYDALKNIEAFLNNTNVDGTFLFSGSRGTTESVDLGLGVSLDEFQASNDGNLLAVATTRDAHLAEFSISKDTININKLFLDTSKFLIFRQDDDGDTTTAGDSTIEATSALFAGITEGTRINVTGTTSNNGVHTVKSVSSDGTKITIVNEMLTDETVGNGVFTLADATTLKSADTGFVTFNRTANTITAATANAFANVKVGQVITVAGTAENNNTYTVTANSGTPLTATVLGNQANAGGSGVVGSGRASATGLPIGLSGFFFNPQAFTTPAPGALGNAARNTIPGPRRLALNLSLGRSFRLDDARRSVEFRVEANNVTNTVSFTRLGTTVNSSNYGLASGAAAMRRITANLRFRF